MDISKLSGLGMDHIEEAQSLPLIKILQDGCAEIKKNHKDHATKRIEGAEAGDIVLSSKSKVLPQPVEILPLAQQACYVEWRPKSAGGGIVSYHGPEIVAHPDYRKGTPENKNKEFLGQNDLVWTDNFCILVNIDGEWEKAVIAFTSSNLKHARTLKRQITTFEYPAEMNTEIKPFTFSRSFKLGTVPVAGKENSWYEFSIEPNRILNFEADKPLLEQAVSSLEDAIMTLPSPKKQPLLQDRSEPEPF